MTNIKTQLLNTIHEQQFAGHENLRTAVLSGLANAQRATGGDPLEVAAVLFSGSNLPVPNWRERLVGAEEVTVIAAPSATFTELLQSMLQRMQRLESSTAALGAPRLRNVAAQILLVIAGEQDFCQTTTDYYEKLVDPRLPSMATCLSTSVDKLRVAADGVIERRNNTIHPSTVGELDHEVSEVLKFVSPELERMCWWECKVVSEYAQLKALFPDKFV